MCIHCDYSVVFPTEDAREFDDQPQRSLVAGQTLRCLFWGNGDKLIFKHYSPFPGTHESGKLYKSPLIVGCAEVVFAAFSDMKFKRTSHLFDAIVFIQRETVRKTDGKKWKEQSAPAGVADITEVSLCRIIQR